MTQGDNYRLYNYYKRNTNEREMEALPPSKGKEKTTDECITLPTHPHPAIPRAANPRGGSLNPAPTPDR